ncbi:MAG: hypothetical protein AAF357_13835 [Verrucomicrobiota bacterium]
MQFSVFLAESSSSYDSPLFALFLAFAIAAVIWLIIWLLSGEIGEGSSDGSKTSKPKSAAPKKEAKSSPASEPVKETAAAVPSVERPEGTDPAFATASSEEAASLFAEELSGGVVKQDPVYGIVYTSAPDEVDDLKKIKGVAKVLEGKLHSIGVYRFKQVAVWTDAACQEFSTLLTFKNRIYTDNWIAQAKSFHEEKYDEKL